MDCITKILKVVPSVSCKPKNPSLRLQGRAMLFSGFEVDTRLKVCFQPGRITITKYRPEEHIKQVTNKKTTTPNHKQQK